MSEEQGDYRRWCEKCQRETGHENGVCLACLERGMANMRYAPKLEMADLGSDLPPEPSTGPYRVGSIRISGKPRDEDAGMPLTGNDLQIQIMGHDGKWLPLCQITDVTIRMGPNRLVTASLEVEISALDLDALQIKKLNGIHVVDNAEDAQRLFDGPNPDTGARNSIQHELGFPFRIPEDVKIDRIVTYRAMESGEADVYRNVRREDLPRQVEDDGA